ncbi:MAG: CPBP family intramembrane metalloprotease [Desulfobulbaceae bacterium]|nr:CPBP family intramembrane metalloprotease [Desulfobulbaceae bacterium]
MTEFSKKIALLILVFPLVIFIYKYHSKAFPEISPDFSLTKSAIIEKADSYVRSFGFDPDIYHQVQTFNENTTDKFFLERQYGVEKLTSDIKAGVTIWYWTVRNFIAGEQEEFSIDIDPEGNLVGFLHTFAETTVRPTLSKEAALEKAEQFLQLYIPQHPLGKLELEEVSEEEKPGYYRYSFTWKRSDWQWGTGIYHLHLRVDGDQVGQYYEHLKVPHEWRRDFAKKRSVNRIYGLIAWSAASLLALGILVMFVRIMLRNRNLWQRFPMLWTVPVGLLLLASAFSGFPGLLSSYSTQDNFHVFITNSILSTAFSTFGSLIWFLILGFMADIFWHKAFPHHVPIRSLLSTRGFATKEAMESVPLGFALAILSLAYITAYYLVGSRFHVWVPTSIDYSKVLTSFFPSLEALAVGVRAAWMEELFFRVLALVFIYRLTGSKWLAIILSATVWGFMHSNYPQMPGYARGVELTIEGIFLGWVAVRFGILTTVLSHCLFNTWLGAIFAWRTGSHFHMIMAVLVSVWPVAIWIFAQMKVRRLGRFLNPEELMNGKPFAEQIKEAKAILAARYRKPRRSVLLGSFFAVAAMLLVLFMQPEKPLSDLGSVHLTPKAARQYADAYFVEQTGLSAQAYHRTTSYYSTMSDADTDYLLEYTDWKTLAGLMRNSLYQENWYVSYFKAEDKNTFLVTLTADGQPLLLTRSVGEEEPGAQIDQDEAVSLAAAYLAERLQLTRDRFRMVSYDMSQKPDRRDHYITFESTDWHIGESKLRWSVSLLGDNINNFYSEVIVPEKFLRERSALSWTDAVSNMISQTTSLLSLAGLIILFIALLKGRYINWRHSLLLGLSGLIITVISQVNQLSDLYAGYSTTQTMMNFLGSKALQVLMSLVMSYFYSAFYFAVLTGLLRWLTGVNAVPALLGNNLQDARQRFSHGATTALLAWALLWGVDQLSSFMSLAFSDAGMLSWNTFMPSGFSTGVSYLTAGLNNSLFTSLTSGIVVLILILIRKKHQGLLFLGIAFLIITDLDISWQGGIEAVFSILFQVLVSLLELWVLLRLLRFNAYGYLFLFFYQFLLPSAFLLSLKGWPVYRVDIFMLWAAFFIPILLSIFFMLTPSVKGTCPEKV